MREQFPELGGNVIMKKAKSKKNRKYGKRPAPKVQPQMEEGDYWRAKGLVIKPIGFDEILIEIPKKNLPKEVEEGKLIWGDYLV